MRAVRFRSVGLVAALVAVGAPAASAADSPSLGCLAYDGVTFFSIDDFESVGYPFDAGERLTVSFGDPRGGAETGSIVVGGTTVTTPTIPGAVSYTFPTSDVTDFRLVVGPSGVASATFTCTEPESVAPVPAWVQEYARPSADAACADAWTPSWSRWPNAGSGGFVCVRSVPSVG